MNKLTSADDGGKADGVLEVGTCCDQIKTCCIQ